MGCIGQSEYFKQGLGLMPIIKKLNIHLTEYLDQTDVYLKSFFWSSQIRMNLTCSTNTLKSGREPVYYLSYYFPSKSVILFEE